MKLLACAPPLLVLSLALGTRAHADPIEVRSGPVVLPLTGLEIELPKDKRKNATWALAGGWSLSNGGASFEGRDVIDQKVDGKIVAGNWVHIGWFNAGDCGGVVQQLDVPDRWTADRSLWGRDWKVAGGTTDFGNELGKAPTIALCSARPGAASLLLYHFFIGAPLDRDHEALMQDIAGDPLLERLARAWEKGTTHLVLPLKHPELRRRGDIEAARKVHLPKANIDVNLPDDGLVWLVRGDDKDATSDFLDLMAPALPDLSIEVARVPGMACNALFDWNAADAPKRKDEPAPKGVPEGWAALGTLVVESGLERVVCRDHAGTALVAGLLATPSDIPPARDFAPFAPLLGALAAGSDAAPATAP